MKYRSPRPGRRALIRGAAFGLIFVAGLLVGGTTRAPARAEQTGVRGDDMEAAVAAVVAAGDAELLEELERIEARLTRIKLNRMIREAQADQIERDKDRMTQELIALRQRNRRGRRTMAVARGLVGRGG